MFGIDDLMYIGIAAALAGAATSGYGSYKNAKSADKQAAQAILQQDEDQQKTDDLVSDAIEQHQIENATDTKQQEQEHIAGEMTDAVNEAQAGLNDSSTVNGNVSDEYTAAKAAANQKVLDDAAERIKYRSQMLAGNRLQQDEAQYRARMAGDIGAQNLENKWRDAIYQAEIKNAAEKYNGVVNGGQILGAAGTVMSMGAGAAGAAANAGTAATQTMTAEEAAAQAAQTTALENAGTLNAAEASQAFDTPATMALDTPAYETDAAMGYGTVGNETLGGDAYTQGMDAIGSNYTPAGFTDSSTAGNPNAVAQANAKIAETAENNRLADEFVKSASTPSNTETSTLNSIGDKISKAWNEFMTPTHSDQWRKSMMMATAGANALGSAAAGRNNNSSTTAGWGL